MSKNSQQVYFLFKDEVDLLTNGLEEYVQLNKELGVVSEDTGCSVEYAVDNTTVEFTDKDIEIISQYCNLKEKMKDFFEDIQKQVCGELIWEDLKKFKQDIEDASGSDNDVTGTIQ